MPSADDSPTSSDNPLPLTPTESKSPVVDIVIVTTPPDLEAAHSPSATTKPLTINARSFGASANVQSLRIQAMTARTAPGYKYLLVEDTSAEWEEEQEVPGLSTGSANPEQNLKQNAKQNPTVKPKTRPKRRFDCPRPGCHERQEERSGYCILHTCLAVNADKTRCPNEVLNPLSSRYCRSGYHVENGRHKELEKLVARRINFDVEQAQARDASIAASMLWSKTHCPSLEPIYPHLWVPGFDNTKADPFPTTNNANPYATQAELRQGRRNRHLDGIWGLPRPRTVGKE